jgi:hypothetical protein
MASSFGTGGASGKRGKAFSDAGSPLQGKSVGGFHWERFD